MGTVIHWAASRGRKKASIGTSLPDTSLNRFAKPKDASLRPAKMLRRCHSEQPTVAARTETVIPLPLAQRSIGCKSDMGRSIPTRNGESQPEIFLEGIGRFQNDLVESAMAKKAKPELSQMHLKDWLGYFELGPTAAAKHAGCTQPYISNMMAGRRTSVNVLYLVKLTEEIGITVNDLYRPAPTKLQLAQLQSYSPQAQATILQRARKKS